MFISSLKDGELVLVSAASPFSFLLMPGFQSRGNVCPEGLCDVPARCVLWLESCGSHTELEILFVLLALC